MGKPKLRITKNKSFLFQPRETSSNDDTYCIEIPKVEYYRNKRKVIECKNPIWPEKHVKNLRDYKSILKINEKARRETTKTYRKQTKANRGRLG